MKQHPSAIIEPGARIDEDVEIGPFCIIKEGAVIGPGNRFHSHCVIHGVVTIGSGNTFHQGCSIGDVPQDLSYEGTDTRVEIGNDNTFREFCTVHRGTEKDRTLTTVGNNGYFMGYTHIAHDCIVGDHVQMTNTAQLAGHTIVEDYATIGPFCGLHQFCRIGRYSFIGAGTIVTQDVVPYSLVVADIGNRAKVYGHNAIGLKRAGFSLEQLQNIKRAFRILFKSDLNTSQALDKISREFSYSVEVDNIVTFIQSAKRGIIK